MSDRQYYVNQLVKLDLGTDCKMSVKLWDGNGNHTNTMDLTNECIDVLIHFLKIQKEKNNEKDQ